MTVLEGIVFKGSNFTFGQMSRMISVENSADELTGFFLQFV